ncbi:MAG: EamA family transporter [Candidatus Woesearchaeota archaeon]|nr:EamA family transporter [Candidatus Woesearchaeota archaeon]
MEWYVFVLISALVFGIGNVVRKKALTKEHSMQFITTFQTVYFIAMLLLLPKVNFDSPMFIWAFIYIKSVLLLLATYFFIRLLRHNEISEIEPLWNLSPVFLLLLSYFMLNEAPSFINVVGVILIVGGAYVIETDHKITNIFKPISLLKSKKIIYILFFLIFISLCSVIDKIVLIQIDPYSFLFIQSMFMFVNCIIVQFTIYEGIKDIKTALKRDFFYIMLAVVLFIISDVFYFIAVSIPTAMVSLIIPIKRTSTIISTVLGGKIFHEKGLKIKISACIIMVLGIFLVLR